jgi:hypothetical protein
MRILVVEDEKAIAADIAEALAGIGYVVEVATDGEDAWFRGSTEDYDAIVLDRSRKVPPRSTPSRSPAKAELPSRMKDDSPSWGAERGNVSSPIKSRPKIGTDSPVFSTTPKPSTRGEKSNG